MLNNGAVITGNLPLQVEAVRNQRALAPLC